MIYKVTQPKIIFCDLENFKIAEEVKLTLNLDIPIYIVNDKYSGVAGDGHIKDLLKEVRYRIEGNFRYVSGIFDGPETFCIDR